MNGGRTWFRETFVANPLIERHRFSLFRPATLWIHVSMYAVIAGVIVLANYAIQRAAGGWDTATFWRSLFFQFLFLDVVILWFWASYNTATALPGEIANRSFDFFKALPLTAHQKAAGIVVGTNLLAYLLGAVTWLPLLGFAGAGGVAPGMQAQIFFLVVSLALLFNTAALLSSIQPRRPSRQRSSPLTLVFVMVFFVLPAFSNAFMLLHEYDTHPVAVRFYRLEAPLLVTISLVALYFSAWTGAGLLRKFTREREPLFSPLGAFLFVAGFEFITAGFFQPYLREEGAPLVAACWLVGLAPLVLVPGGTLKDANRYIEHARLIARRPLPPGGRWAALATYSNFALGLLLFAAWALFALATGLWTQLPAARIAGHLLVLLSFYAFFLLLQELFVLFRHVSAAVRNLLILIAVLDIILPFILSPLAKGTAVILYGPLGYFSLLVAGRGLGPVHLRVAAFNLVLIAVPAVLVARRYQAILKLRQQMQGGGPPPL